MKFFIAVPNEISGVLVLVDEKNNLFSAYSIIEAEDSFRDIFGKTLEIGKIFHEDRDVFFFAAINSKNSTKPLETLPAGWSLKSCADLNTDNCPDFEAIKIGFKKLGF